MAGIYIHIPFCKQACNYCNFHFSTSLQLKETLIHAIAKEIELTQPFAEDEVIETIYFGGGTPSIINATELTLLLESLYKKYKVAADAEITLEANPDDVDTEKLKMWKKAGINRLSIGIQSFVEEELKWMNRTHNAAEALHCIDLAREVGFHNFSIDLIYGSPLLSDEQWQANMQTVIDKKVPHISAYALTVEPKTALEKMIARKTKQAPDADKQARQFLQLTQTLTAAGYDHYEISNFAFPSQHSKHNSSYWQGKNYYGFGPSAHSFNGKQRRWNLANNALYIQAINKDTIPFEEEKLTTEQHLNEYIMTALRTMYGINLEKIEKDFGANYRLVLGKAAEKWIAEEKAFMKDEHLILTQEGKLFADGIAADLFF